MNFSMTEVALICVQVLLIPFGRYILTSQKKEIISDILKVVNEHYICLEDMIDVNKNQLDVLTAKIAHRGEIGHIKNTILESRIIDLENFLQKHEQFQAKCRICSDKLNEFKD